MDYAVTVEVLEALGDFDGKAPDFFFGEELPLASLLLEELAYLTFHRYHVEISTRSVLHEDVEALGLDEGRVVANDVGVHKFAEDEDFLQGFALMLGLEMFH